MLVPGQEVNGYEILTSHRDISDPTIGAFIARHQETGEFRVGVFSDDLADLFAMQTGKTFDSYPNAVKEFTRDLSNEAYDYEVERDIARAQEAANYVDSF